MKRILFIIVAVFISFNIDAQTVDCSRTTKFGEVDLCLPNIDGYQECYLNPEIKQIADATEVPTNVVLGYYLNNATLGNIDDPELPYFTDFFKVYGTLQVKDLEADEAILKEMQEVLEGNFFSANWGEIKDELAELELEIEVGEPRMIESYNLNKESFSLIMLTKYDLDEENSYTLAMVINGILLKDRLVWMAYYLEYEDQSTFETIKAKSNLITNSLLKANR